MDESNRASPRKLRSLLIQHLEGEDVTSLEDAGMSLLLGISDKIDKLKEKNKSNDETQSKQMTPQGRLLRKGDTVSNNVDEVRESSSAPNFQELVTVSI